MNVFHHINRWKDKRHESFQKAEGKHLTKYDTIHDKNSQKHGLEGNFLNRTKGIYKKTTANIILHGERITFSPEVRNVKVVHFHSFYSTLYCRSNPAVKQEKNKKHPGGKGRNKVIFICR